MQGLLAAAQNRDLGAKTALQAKVNEAQNAKTKADEALAAAQAEAAREKTKVGPKCGRYPRGRHEQPKPICKLPKPPPPRPKPPPKPRPPKLPRKWSTILRPSNCVIQPLIALWKSRRRRSSLRPMPLKVPVHRTRTWPRRESRHRQRRRRQGRAGCRRQWPAAMTLWPPPSGQRRDGQLVKAEAAGPAMRRSCMKRRNRRRRRRSALQGFPGRQGKSRCRIEGWNKVEAALAAFQKARWPLRAPN